VPIGDVGKGFTNDDLRQLLYAMKNLYALMKKHKQASMQYFVFTMKRDYLGSLSQEQLPRMIKEAFRLHSPILQQAFIDKYVTGITQ